MDKSIIVNLVNVSKRYDIGSGGEDEFYALKNVNLTVRSGDRIGIMGNNGAGKSTLLKIISGIIKPSFGRVEVSGKVVSLMSLEAGFKLDLTGRENILLNGLLVGMDGLEIKSKIEEIIMYSELGDFIDEPFYKYSAGMKFRLAFSIAIVSSCDLLILDEILMAGDFSFQQKVFRSLIEFQKEKVKMATIICSHVPDFIWGFSKKYFVMNGGILENLSKRDMVVALKSKRVLWDELFNLKF